MNTPHTQSTIIKQAVEQKAFAYGISRAVSTLLGEYAQTLINSMYEQPKTQLVQQPS